MYTAELKVESQMFFDQNANGFGILKRVCVCVCGRDVRCECLCRKRKWGFMEPKLPSTVQSAD